MAHRESFDSLLQALQSAWLRGCDAAAAQFQAALAWWTTVSEDGTAVPQRLVLPLPNQALPPSPATLELDWSDLCRRQWMRPASMSLSFDCELRQRRDRSWHLLVIRGVGRLWKGRRPRHRVEIVVHGRYDAGGEVWFDGHLWRRFGAAAQEQAR